MIAPIKAAPILPTEELVRAACSEYDGDMAERALKELFAQYPRNNDCAHVLLKVVALNRLYSAGILSVYDVADHICVQEMDAALSDGEPEVVDRIAKVTISSSGKQRGFWSFATKYCSWHNQASYPIWDSRVADTSAVSIRTSAPRIRFHSLIQIIGPTIESSGI
jgi:hypothetical protein